MPHGIDMAGYTSSFTASVKRLLNQRPRKCLNGLSPEEFTLQASFHVEWQTAPLKDFASDDFQ